MRSGHNKMPHAALPSSARVSERLSYNSETGCFTWKSLIGYSPETTRWNARYAGKLAGCISDKGYLRIRLFGRAWSSHRLAYLLSFGDFSGDIDHINGNRLDNRLENLRLVSSSVNQKNRRIFSNNSSGVVGIDYDPRMKRWRGRIASEGKRIFLGHFQTIEDAQAARLAAQSQLGFHPNHGHQGEQKWA